MAKTYCCLLPICLIHQLLGSFAIPSNVLFLSDHVPCGKTTNSHHIVSCHTQDFPRLAFRFESLSSPLSLSSKKLDHMTVNINTLETFLNENVTVKLSATVHDRSICQALGKIIRLMINESEHKVSDNRDEEDLKDCDSSAESRSTNSPDISQAEENGEKIAEVKDNGFTENNVGYVEGKCNVSCERSCQVHSISANVLSSYEANVDEAESVAMETHATAPPPPPTDPKRRRTQTGSDPIPGAQVFHAHQEIQALKSFNEENVVGRESCCPLQLIILFLGLCISRIEF